VASQSEEVDSESELVFWGVLSLIVPFGLNIALLFDDSAKHLVAAPVGSDVHRINALASSAAIEEMLLLSVFYPLFLYTIRGAIFRIHQLYHFLYSFHG
jgi:hypothetical protein